MSEQTPTPSEAPAEGGLLTGKNPAPEPKPEGGLLTSGETSEPEANVGGGAPTGEAEGEAKEPEGAPEEYADFEAPEGVTFDTDLVGDLKGLAKELNLPQGKAQAIADLGVKIAQKWQDQIAESWNATVESWKTESTKQFDPPKLATAKRALEAFGDAELTKFITGGVENHPAFINFLVKVGETVSEDRFVAGGKATPSDLPLADRIFGTTAK